MKPGDTAATLKTVRRPATRRMLMLGIEQGQILDAIGPLEVFASANRRLDAIGSPGPRYQVELVACRRGAIQMSSGLSLLAQRALGDVRGAIDTLLLPGGTGVRQVLADRALIDWIRRTSGRARRVASVCTGAFLLAEAGLLDGRRATTHWSACEELAQRYPALRIESDPIFVKDGKFYSSAGVTAGMDLALALVEEDHGRDLALMVARWLVVFLKRPGGQSQFSSQLRGQLAERTPLRELQTWVLGSLAADLSVRTLASRVGMSPRNFARVFGREVGLTPARFVENSRVEAARRLLEESHEGVEQVAARVGFGSAEAMRRAFLRQVRVAPADYRSRFQRVAVRDEHPEERRKRWARR